jgi:hypothetical protein
MNDRRCRYCQRLFQPSRFHPQQAVCSQPSCQQQRQRDYHREKIASDAVYRQVCLESPRKWREAHPGYWKDYRQSHPQAVERNRRRQQLRDQRRRLAHLANNNLALDLKHSAAEVWLLGQPIRHLANNNLAPCQVLTTVSVVLNNVPGRSIPAETRERVRAAARKFNYQPSLLARSLRKQRTFTVGVLAPELSDGYHTMVMSGIGDHLMREGYFYFTAHHRHKPDMIEEYPRLLLGRGAEGLIALTRR